MKKILRILAPVFGLTLLALLIFHYDRSAVAASFLNADLFWVLVAACGLTGSALLGAINVFLLFRPEERAVGFLRFLRIYWISWAVAQVVPGQVGDLVTTSVLLKKQGTSIRISLGLLLIDKAISLSVMVCFAVYGLYAVRSAVDIELLRFEWLGVVVLSIIVTGLFGVFLFGSRGKFKEHKLAKFIRGTFSKIRTTCLQYPRAVLRNAAITVIKLLMTGFAYYAVLRGLGATDLSFLTISGVALASGLVAYLPISFNGLGTVEITGVLLFKALGVLESTTLSAYLLLRVLVLVIAWVPNLTSKSRHTFKTPNDELGVEQ